jgi:HEAT repeat protein
VEAKQPADAPAEPKRPTDPPAKSTTPALLPESSPPRDLLGDEVYRRLLRSSAFIVTPGKGAGSGVLIDSARRLVVTNLHVVKDHEKVIVLFPAFDNETQVITDPKYYLDRAKESGLVAEVVARSVSRDLALVQLAKLPPDVAPVAISRQPAATGTTVYSVGGSGVDDDLLWRLSTGTVRGRARVKDRYSQGVLDAMTLETQSPVNRGDSGGPVVNGRVELVGIVDAFRTDARLVSINIDVTEVRAFVAEYFRTVGDTWKEPQPDAPPPAAASVFDNLLAVLKGGSPADRITAARRLGNLRAQARSAVPALLAALDSGDQELHAAVGTALSQIGPPESGAERILLPALRSKSPVAKSYAARMFATDALIPGDSVKDVVAAFKDASPEVRAFAVQAVGKVGPKARPVALAGLLDRLADADRTVRDGATAAVQSIGLPEAEDRPILLAHLKHDDLRVRVAATALLRQITTSPEDARDLWLPLLKDREPKLRLAAVTALSASVDLLTGAGANILPLLDDSDPAVRAAAAHGVRHLTKTIGAVEKLSKCLESETDATVKAALAESLVIMLKADVANLNLFRKLMKDGAPSVREEAAKKLAAIGPEASEAIPDLIGRIGDEETGVRVAALKALAAMGLSAKDAIPVAAALFDRDRTPPPVLVVAVDVLAACGGDGLKHLETLSKKVLPRDVREQMCVAFAGVKSPSDEMRLWMLDQAEVLTESREVIAGTFVRTGTNATLLELLRRTHFYKPGKVGSKLEEYDVGYRKWALITVGKMNVEKIATRETRAYVLERLEYLSKNDNSPEVVAEAAVALTKLKK